MWARGDFYFGIPTRVYLLCQVVEIPTYTYLFLLVLVRI